MKKLVIFIFFIILLFNVEVGHGYNISELNIDVENNYLRSRHTYWSPDSEKIAIIVDENILIINI